MTKTKPLSHGHLEKIVPYQAGKPIEELAREKGLTTISKLASNENPLGPSKSCVEVVEKSLSNLNRYPDMNGHDLKKALSDHHGIPPERIILGSGSEGVMTYIAKAFLGVGDEVLTSSNSFIGFYIIAKASGASLKLISPRESHQFDMETIEKSITPKTKIIYLANPNNPTGTIITKSELESLLKKCPPNIIIIMDEAYFEYAKDHKSYPNSLDYNYPNIISLRTFSKAYGLAALRVGYGVASEEIVTTLTKVKPPFEPNLLGQAAACEALKDQDHIKQGIIENKTEYERLFNYLKDKNLNPIPSFTNFVTFFTKSAENSDWLFEQLLNQGVIIRKLGANNMHDFIRISIGTKQEMDHFYESFDKISNEFQNKMKG